MDEAGERCFKMEVLKCVFSKAVWHREDGLVLEIMKHDSWCFFKSIDQMFEFRNAYVRK